eukprot:3989250-Pyramimonas_sp.AAC.1
MSAAQRYRLAIRRRPQLTMRGGWGNVRREAMQTTTNALSGVQRTTARCTKYQNILRSEARFINVGRAGA